MDSFESLVSMLLRHDGFWTTPNFKVELTKEEKRRINRFSAPRWELDLIAYKGSTNEVLAIECKSYLDSTGVIFRNGAFEPADRYKLFVDPALRSVVMKRLARQLLSTGACAPSPRIILCLATGKIATKSDQKGLHRHFAKNRWRLFDPEWLRQGLMAAAGAGYENDIAFVVSKLLLRKSAKTRPAAVSE